MADRKPTDGLENMIQKLIQTPESLVATKEGLSSLAVEPWLVLPPSPMYKKVPETDFKAYNTNPCHLERHTVYVPSINFLLLFLLIRVLPLIPSSARTPH